MKSPLQTIQSMADELDMKMVSTKEPQFLFLTNKEIHALEDDFIQKGFAMAMRYDAPKYEDSIPYDNLKPLVSLTINTGGYSFLIIRHFTNSGNYEWHKLQS